MKLEFSVDPPGFMLGCPGKSIGFGVEQIMTYDSLIFDLDGTLWDASWSSARAWNLGLERSGLSSRTITRQDITRVSGLPFEQCVELLFPEISPAEFKQLTRFLDTAEAEVFAEQGGPLYPGVASGLEKLSRRSPLFLVSNCQEWYLDNFFRLTGLGPMFRDYECYGRTGRPKADNIQAVVSRHNLVEPIYIGDTAGDFEAASRAGVTFIHLGHGFGRKPDLSLSLSGFDRLVEYLLEE